MNNIKNETNNENMGYFNYHAIAKRLIITGHCTFAEIKERHNKISPALVLFFDNHKPMPIRKESFDRYIMLLRFYEIPISSIVDKK